MKAIKDELRLIPLLFLGPASALLAFAKWEKESTEFEAYIPLLAGFAVLAIGVAVALKLRLLDR